MISEYDMTWITAVAFSVLEDKFKKEKEFSELELFGTIFLICSLFLETCKLDESMHIYILHFLLFRETI